MVICDHRHAEETMRTWVKCRTTYEEIGPFRRVKKWQRRCGEILVESNFHPACCFTRRENLSCASDARRTSPAFSAAIGGCDWSHRSRGNRWLQPALKLDGKQISHQAVCRHAQPQRSP